jgi:hypothetical protein
VRPQLVYAVIDAESKRDPAAISRAGAMGLMQLMPATSAEYGVVNPFDPQANVAGGVHYLRDLLARYHGNVDDALAAYNAGPGVVDADHGVPAYPETRSYVARVTAELHSWQSLRASAAAHTPAALARGCRCRFSTRTSCANSPARSRSASVRCTSSGSRTSSCSPPIT